MPTAINADTAKHVGLPKFRLPTSEYSCPVIFRSFVHLTTSQGACGGSSDVASPCEEPLKGDSCEDSEICLECGDRNAGDAPRDEGDGDNVGLPSNLRSKGCKAPEADREGNLRGVEGRVRFGVDV